MARGVKIIKSIDITRIFLGVLVMIGGAILPLAFAPFGYYLIAETSLVILLFVWLRASRPLLAFLYGWLFGLTFFGFGIYWVYVSVHYYGNAPTVLAIFIVALLVAFMALYPALQGYCLHRFFSKNNLWKFLGVFPAIFVILEWIRGWFLSGFPWLFLGYSHVASPLSGWATVFGVYGVSFVIAQTAGAVFSIFYWWRNKKLVAGLLLLIFMLWGVGGAIAKINWTKQSGERFRVSLVQGNITQERKWQKSELLSILDTYSFLTTSNLASKIIVWPEAAIPTVPENIKLYLQRLSFVAEKSKTTIVSGVPFYDKDNNNYYNGILVFGASQGRYYKRHLVPFGEFLPLQFMLWWLHKFLTIPMSGFSYGAKQQPDLVVDNILLAPFICYEIAYANLVLDYLPRAKFLVVVSDDSWFGESIAAAQHLEIAKMRALEVGRYLLFSTNTGISAIINQRGEIVAAAPAFQPAVVSAEVMSFVGKTPWVNYGKYLWLPLLLLCLWLAYRWKS